MDYKKVLAQFLSCNDLRSEDFFPLMVDQDGKMADIALPCHKLAAKLKKSPVEIAKELKKRLDSAAPEWMDRAEAINGYLNVFLNRLYYVAEVMEKEMGRGEDFKVRQKNGKTITIDYSSINIAKPFHIGHLLTTVIGGSLYRIFKYLGYNAIGINHLGDWGTQFGKLIVAVKKWGGGDTIEELSKLYVKFHQEAEKDESLNEEGRRWFKKIEDGDSEALELFHKFKKITLEEVDSVYKMLGVEFDSYNGESFYNDKMQPVLDILNEKGLLTQSEGAKVVDLSKYDMPPCLILKSDGASLYATRDLAAAMYRKQTYTFDQNLYVVAYQQTLHFKQVFKVLELMGFDWADRCKHIPFGMVSLEGGGSLSTRKGNVVLLKDVLNTAISKTLEIIDSKNPELENKHQVASDVGIGAVIFGALYNSRIKDVVFSFNKALSFEGETGPYLQYTHARCCSVLEKGTMYEKLEYSELTDDESFEIIRLLDDFDRVVEEAAEKYEPSIISRYLINLAKSYNRFYISHRIIGESKKTQSARMKLTECVRNTLKNGMRLILLNAPEKM